MDSLATPTSPTARSSRHFGWVALALFLTLPVVLVACEITEVVQPLVAAQDEVISVVVTITNPTNDANAHRGVLAVLVPTDWAFVAGSYDGDAGAGVMEEAPATVTLADAVLPPPAGMKWIGTRTETPQTVDGAPETYDVTLQLRVGQTLGTFALGYFTSSTAFAPADIVFGATGTNTADSLMNQPITVNIGVSAENGARNAAFVLEPNHPNPFRSSTAIRYALDRPATVSVSVLDLRGRELAVVARGLKPAGHHTADFEATGLASGTYLVRLAVDGHAVQTRRMTLSR